MLHEGTPKAKLLTKSLHFLSGRGEMGALVRAYNRESSLLGPIEEWPQSLLTTPRILFISKFPMFIFGGPQLVCFYNDANRATLGKEGKHPSILGMRGEEAWPEIGHIIKPLIDMMLSED